MECGCLNSRLQAQRLQEYLSRRRSFSPTSARGVARAWGGDARRPVVIGVRLKMCASTNKFTPKPRPKARTKADLQNKTNGKEKRGQLARLQKTHRTPYGSRYQHPQGCCQSATQVACKHSLPMCWQPIHPGPSQR